MLECNDHGPCEVALNCNVWGGMESNPLMVVCLSVIGKFWRVYVRFGRQHLYVTKGHSTPELEGP